MQMLHNPSQDYPDLFGIIRPVPEQLFYEGSLDVLRTHTLSVVGSRKMSSYGQQVVRNLLPPLIRAGVTIVSGLAYGIDAEAHRVTLEHKGKGIAVIGSSLDQLYPQAHKTLSENLIREGGLLISEYAPGTPGYKGNFPARNRIIAALSRVLLIIEAADPSGTFSTARAALDMGREVCVVPADITREQSNGTLRLLKEGARPVSCAEDIVSLYQLELPHIAPPVLKPALTGSPATLYACISHGAHSVDDLVRETGWSVSTVQAVLSTLELDGYISFQSTEWQTIS